MRPSRKNRHFIVYRYQPAWNCVVRISRSASFSAATPAKQSVSGERQSPAEPPSSQTVVGGTVGSA